MIKGVELLPPHSHPENQPATWTGRKSSSQLGIAAALAGVDHFRCDGGTRDGLDAATCTAILFLFSRTALSQKRNCKHRVSLRKQKLPMRRRGKRVLEESDSAQHALLIHINELDAPLPIEASVIEAELSSDASVPVLQEATLPNES